MRTSNNEFNIFLIISEAWQGYESKTYGVSNHHLNLQSKNFSRSRDIRNFPTQGLADTAFYTRNWSETYKWGQNCISAIIVIRGHVCPSSFSQGGPHVTIIHDPLDLTVQPPPPPNLRPGHQTWDPASPCLLLSDIKQGPPPSIVPSPVKSNGHHWKPVQTCSFGGPKSNIHIRFASVWYASYWSGFLFTFINLCLLLFLSWRLTAAMKPLSYINWQLMKFVVFI